jgi:hypothetical protein
MNPSAMETELSASTKADLLSIGTVRIENHFFRENLRVLRQSGMKQTVHQFFLELEKEE